MEKELEETKLKKLKWRKRLADISFILLLFFIGYRLYDLFTMHKYGMENIDYIKAAFLSFIFCFSMGIFFYCMRSEQYYSDVLELSNERLRQENEDIKRENSKLKRALKEMCENKIINYDR